MEEDVCYCFNLFWLWNVFSVLVNMSLGRLIYTNFCVLRNATEWFILRWARASIRRPEGRERSSQPRFNEHTAQQVHVTFRWSCMNRWPQTHAVTVYSTRTSHVWFFHISISSLTFIIVRKVPVALLQPVVEEVFQHFTEVKVEKY